MTATSQPVLAYRAKDALEAHALAAYLEAAGIEPHILGEFLQGAYAGVNLGGMNTPEIWVSSEELARAESAIAQWREELDAQIDPDRLTRSGVNVKPFKLQFSMAALLWLMTFVAILAAGVAFELVTYANWPAWIFSLLVFTLTLLVARKGASRLASKTSRRRDDNRSPKVR